MIEVTHFNGASAVVNLDMIERIERTPDTLIILANGNKLLVRETPEQLVDRALAYKRNQVVSEPGR